MPLRRAGSEQNCSPSLDNAAVCRTGDGVVTSAIGEGAGIVAFAKICVAAAVVAADLSEQFCSDVAGSARLDCPVSIFVSAPTGMTAQRVRAGMVRQTAVTRT